MNNGIISPRMLLFMLGACDQVDAVRAEVLSCLKMRWGFYLSRVERAAAAATRARNAHVLFPLYVTYSR